MIIELLEKLRIAGEAIALGKSVELLGKERYKYWD